MPWLRPVSAAEDETQETHTSLYRIVASGGDARKKYVADGEFEMVLKTAMKESKHRPA